MLIDDLKEVQRKKKHIYKILAQYLSKMGMKELMSLNDYFNMVQLTNEIDGLNKEGQRIVKQIDENIMEGRV